MARHRTHSLEFKRQVAQEYLGGETLHGLAKRHDLSRVFRRAILTPGWGKSASKIDPLRIERSGSLLVLSERAVEDADCGDDRPDTA